MAKTKNKKHIRAKSNDELKADQLRTCTVVLHNVALDKDLVRLYRSAFSKKEELKHTTPCINVSEKSSNNVWMLKENIQEDNTKDEAPLTRSHVKRLAKKESEECKNVEFLDNLSSNRFSKIVEPEFVAQEQQAKRDTSVKSFSSSESDDETSSVSSSYNHIQKKTVLSNRKKLLSNRSPSIQKKSSLICKKKLQFNNSGTSTELMQISFDDENYLEEKNITSIEYNNKIQEISNKFIKKCNINLYTAAVRLEQYLERNQNSKTIFSNIINTDVENKKMSGMSEDSKMDFKSKNTNFSENFLTKCNNINGNQEKDATTRSSNETISLTVNNTITTDVLDPFALKSISLTEFKTDHVTKMPDLLMTYNKKQCTNKTNNKRTTRKNLPKITGDHVLPKGTIKMMKINNTRDESSAYKQVFVEQNEYSDNNSDTKQVSCSDNVLDSTNILKEKEYDKFEINESNDTLKISEFTVLNNNIDLKNKNIDNKCHSIPQKSDCKNIDLLIERRNEIHNNMNVNDTETAEIKENCTFNHKEQSDKLHSEKHASDILQDDKKGNKKIFDENILNENTSNLMNVNENYNINGSLISVSKGEAVKQNRKRIAEEDIDIKLDNKKKRLNRTIWLQKNVTYAKSLNHQQFNDFPSINTIVTAESNICKENNVEQRIDLREHLNKKKLKQPTFENKFNNKNSMEFKQIDLNNEKDAINPTSTPINTRNEKFRKRLSFEIEPTFDETSRDEKDIQIHLVCKNSNYRTLPSTLEETQPSQIDSSSSHRTLPSTLEETQSSQINSSNENTNVQKELTNSRNEDEDDCISLFAESFDTNLYETFLSEPQRKPSKSVHSDAPYIMTTSSFNKYVKQNATEFNKEYAEYVENDIKTSNKTNETNKEHNHSRQTVNTDHALETKTTLKIISLETKNEEISMHPWSKKSTFMNLIKGYCFLVVRKGLCYKSPKLCRFKHDLQPLIRAVCSEDPRVILDIIREVLHLGYSYFFRRVYLQLIQILTIDHILIIYQMLHEIRPCSSKDEFTITLKRHMTHDVIIELLKRQLPLKMMVNQMVTSTKDSNNLMNILTCVEKYIKHGEYWNTVKTLILRLPPDKRIIEKILLDCIKNEKTIDVQDVNSYLINKIPPVLMSQLDKDLLERFKSLLTKEIAKNSHPILLIQNFGERISETIASPDGDTNLSQTESPLHDDIFTNKNVNQIKDYETEMNGETYIMRPIDDLPEAQSVYRDHEHLWKFYMDLERFKKGLLHQDYDYVIKILRKYAEKQDENALFVRSCCNILRTEIKRSEYHLANIIRRTVHMDIFGILGKVLFDIGLNILTGLVDTEAWGLALWLFQSLDVHFTDLPCNAEYYLLSAEIYLANKKAVKAYDLLKYKNIVCTSRNKWYVTNTINDEHVRNKIMYILLDSFCNEFIEHAFCLFQFLLKDQCSQYYPIDLSRYVDKLIMLFLSKKDTNLIAEMANLVLKYTFALNTATCRALISTLVHMDKNLARQIYNYAEAIGIYPAMKLWPITYIMINTDLAEEEIYLTFLQLLRNLIINLGHTIEFAKPHQIKVYLILEIKSINKQFYCAESQNYYNNKAIASIKTLIRDVLKKRFDPPILLMPGKGRIHKLQSKSVINYLQTEYCH